LREAGWEHSQPSFFSCLGVSAYLSRDAFFETLRLVAALPQGSAIVFDVATPSSQISWLERLQRVIVRIKTAVGGEPLLSRFDPQALATDLRTMGFGEVESFAASRLNQRYLQGRKDGLRVAARSALIRAVV
jgi:O-methyltransferase involved in polyketide biosynthesis